MANFTRETNSATLKKLADAHAITLGNTPVNSELFSGGQVHHIFPVSLFDDGPDGVRRRNFITEYFPDFDINNGEYLQVLPNDSNSSLDAAGRNPPIFAAIHHGRSGIHDDYSSFVARSFDELIDAVRKGQLDISDGGLEEILAKQANTIRSGLVSTNSAAVVFQLNHNDPGAAVRLKTALGDTVYNSIASKDYLDLTESEKGLLRKYYSNLLENVRLDLWKIDAIDDIVKPVGGGNFKVGNFVLFSTATAAIIVSTAAEAADAKGSAAIDAGAIALVAYGLHKDGILEEFSVSELIELVSNSNISGIVGDDFSDVATIAMDAALDATLSLAASAIGIGLIWNGVQIVESSKNFDAALEFAASKAVDDSYASQTIQTLHSLVSTAKGLFESDAEVDVEQIVDILYDADPYLAADVSRKLYDIAVAKGLISDDITRTDLNAVLNAIDEQNIDGFDGLDSLSDKVKYLQALDNADQGNLEPIKELLDDLLGECFAEGTLIDMWPQDPLLIPGISEEYDQNKVLAKTYQKPIEEVSIGDWVVSYNKQGDLVPGRVSNTMVNSVKVLLDVFGLKVTPGHVTLCGDGVYAGQYVTMIDILRSDGSFVNREGKLIRAATNCLVGSSGDQLVWVSLCAKGHENSIQIKEKAKIRLGTRVILSDGQDVSIQDLIEASGGIVDKEGYIYCQENHVARPMLWSFGESLPKPQDYILKRSKTTLENIYSAGEWEKLIPRMPFN